MLRVQEVLAEDLKVFKMVLLSRKRIPGSSVEQAD